MSSSVWGWDLLDSAERAVRRPTSPTFTSRFDAETWLGENWRQLAEQGVAAAVLVHNGQAAAPPLALHSS